MFPSLMEINWGQTLQLRQPQMILLVIYPMIYCMYSHCINKPNIPLNYPHHSIPPNPPTIMSFNLLSFIVLIIFPVLLVSSISARPLNIPFISHLYPIYIISTYIHMGYKWDIQWLYIYIIKYAMSMAIHSSTDWPRCSQASWDVPPLVFLGAFLNADLAIKQWGFEHVLTNQLTQIPAFWHEQIDRIQWLTL